MKNLLAILTLALLCFNCEKEPEVTQEPAPTSIELSTSSIYTGLAEGFYVGQFTTDISSGIKYSLVAGDGDSDNASFTIAGDYLKSNVSFDASTGGSKSIRISADNKGSIFEKEFTIEVKVLSGPAPTITSPSFLDGEAFPTDFGADNGNVSPDLIFGNVPDNTESIALMMIDLDFNASVHWAVWNIPGSKTELVKNQTWGSNTVVAITTYGEGYVGPFPPVGDTHRYEISAYFLDADIDLTSANYSQIDKAIAGKAIANAKIIGTYTP